MHSGVRIPPPQPSISTTINMTISEKKLTKNNNGEAEVLKAIAALPAAERAIGKRLHALIKANTPTLLPRTWYGMPSYTNGNKIICFFRGTKKFGERYMTLGFNDVAKLDEGNLWPISFALKKLTATEETRIAALVKKAVN